MSVTRHLQRNFWLGVTSGVAYNLYIVVLSTELVMTWFLSGLTESNLLISLLVPIELGSWYFLQLLLSGYVQRQPCTMPLYRRMGWIRVAAVGGFCLAVLTLGRGQEPVLLAVFLLLFAINSVAAGVAALPFLNIVAKTVPPARRGTYFGWRRFLGGLLGLLAGVLVRSLLSPDSGLVYPANYALLFFVGFLVTAVLVGSFSLVVEPAEVVDPKHVRLGEQLERALRLPLRDRNYGRYLVLRVLLVVTGFAVPFYAVYARRVLGASGDMVGVYLIGLTLAGVLSNLILARISDRLGNRLLLRLAAVAVTLPASTALLIARLPETTVAKSQLFVLVFVFQGLHTTAQVIGGTNYLLELEPSIQRVLYVGMASGVVGLAFFASPLGGALVDWLGFEALFLFVFASAVLAVCVSLRLEEPRRRRVVSVSSV